MKVKLSILAILFLLFYSCNGNDDRRITSIPKKTHPKAESIDSVIVDCNYSFETAVAGIEIPAQILDELQLIDVIYYSTDGKLHQGQLLTNKTLVKDLREMFAFMQKRKFPVAKVIPIVAYNWDDKASMQDNNTYSFCYRNIDFSKHAQGMAIDINPFFNPVRWKKGYEHRINRPIGAVYDSTVAGTFHENHPVVIEFKAHGFRWGHSFKRNFDDHHFEKK